jgi:hypothetical protein
MKLKMKTKARLVQEAQAPRTTERSNIRYSSNHSLIIWGASAASTNSPPDAS